MSTQIHPEAHVSEDAIIGEGTQIGARSFIDKGVIIGENCQIGQNVSIGTNVRLGNAVVIEDEVTITGPVWIADEVRLYQGVCLGDEQQCGRAGDGFTFIMDGSQILSNARIAQGVKIGPKAMVRAGAHVMEDVKKGWVVSGDPATLVIYLNID